MTEELPIVKGMRMVRPSYDDDLKQRLRAGIHKSTDPYELGDEAANHIESCELGISQCLSRIEELEAAITHIWGFYPISVSNPRETIDAIRDFAFNALGEKKDDSD